MLEVIPVQPATYSTKWSSDYFGAVSSALTKRQQNRNQSPSGNDSSSESIQTQKDLEKLKATDREVRTHEAAHQSASGGLASGGASFTYEQGPDGQLYAVGGEVKIDTSEGSTPMETLLKARQIRAAALAPSQPSAQDRAVAMLASRMEAKATQELMEQTNSGNDTTIDSSLLKAYRRPSITTPSLLWETA